MSVFPHSVLKKIASVIFFTFIFFFFYCLSLWRYNIGQVFYYDIGIFARPLWLIAHNLPPIINHKVLGDVHFLGDHFSPSLYALAPLSLFNNTLILLLIEQVLAIVGTGILIYRIALYEKLSYLEAHVIAFVFFVFAGIGNAIVTDWHTEPTAAFFIVLFVFLYFCKNNKLLGIFSFLFYLGLKESNAVTALFFLLPFYVTKIKQRKSILALGFVAIVWFFVATKGIIPFFSHTSYLYSPILPQSYVEYATQFINTYEKRKFIFDVFISFGFIPLFSPFFFISILGELGIRLIPIKSHFQSFTLGMHYNVLLGVLLTLAVIRTITSQKKTWIKRGIIIILILLSVFSAKKITGSPFALITNSVFWNTWSTKSELFKMLEYIPKSGSIMSQNNILPHLIQRKEPIFLLSNNYISLKPNTIILEVTPDQNINNYYSGEISNYTQVKLLRDRLMKDTSYKRIATPYPTLFVFVRR